MAEPPAAGLVWAPPSPALHELQRPQLLGQMPTSQAPPSVLQAAAVVPDSVTSYQHQHQHQHRLSQLEHWLETTGVTTEVKT